MNTYILPILISILATFLLFYLLNRRRWQLWRIIKADDPVQVESARDRVTPSIVPYLMRKYWREEDWTRKRNIIEVLQDQFHPDFPEMMLNYLRAPLTPGDEQVELTKAIALGFIDEEYDKFMTYYNDRVMLAKDIAQVLRANKLQEEKADLLQKPPLPSQNIPDEVSPNQRLANAIGSGDLSKAEWALADGADLNIRFRNGNVKGCSGLMYAILSGRFEIAMLLLEKGADVSYCRPDLQGEYQQGRGQTALWWAANQGHVPLAKELIRRGANVDTPDHFGGTPLTTAASTGQFEMVKYLVNQGADIHASLETPLHSSGEPDGRKAFHLAARNGHLPVVAFLIEAGNDPDEPGGSGYTALMLAAESNFMDLAKELIRLGADVNTKHSGPGGYSALRGWTALVFSINAGLVRMTKFLLDSGADCYYRVPAGERWDGKKLPERGMLDFIKGKRGESIRKLLVERGLS